MRIHGQTLIAYCSTDGVRYKQAADVPVLVERFQRQLEKRLDKKGVAISWQPTPEGCNLSLQFVEINRGSPGLGLFMALFGGLIFSAFVPPGRAQLHGVLQTAMPGSTPLEFSHRQRVAAATAKSMLRVSADRLARKTARTVSRWLERQATEALRARPL